MNQKITTINIIYVKGLNNFEASIENMFNLSLEVITL